MSESRNKAIGKYLSSGVMMLVAILITITPEVRGQSDRTSKADELSDKISSGIPTMPSLETGKVILEKSVDPKTYTLGPGDVLSIFTWGNFQGQYLLPVSPEGVLLIPEIGPVEVAGATIEKAGERISASILKRYRNVKTIISLADLRTFKVYAGGAVYNPGAYPATAVTRVSELINMAGGFLNEDDVDSNFPRESRLISDGIKLSSKRNVLIYRQNGDTLKADILRFEVTGRTRHDPTLLDGDRVFVPVRENLTNLYGIFGAVRNPGYFEYSENDSLANLLELAHGLKINADSAKVTIVRFKPDHRQTFEIQVNLTSEDWNIPVMQDDRVYIKEEIDYHDKYQVQLKGEFKYPGFYAIETDSTKLSEIVRKAGGFTPLASLEEAEMTRVSAEEIIDPEFERLKKMQVADMQESEYEYFRTKSRSKPGRVAVNFARLFVQGDSTKDIILRDGDVINVPRKSRVVNIIGEIPNPGILSYVPETDYRYYLQEAGGFSDRADKHRVTIIKGITSEWRKAKKGKAIEPGDTIWIPEKKQRNYIGLIKDTLIFVGNLATVYLVIQQATK